MVERKPFKSIHIDTEKGIYLLNGKEVSMVSLIDMEGMDNFAALIIKKDNPYFIDIVSEFSNTIAMFQVKPDN